MEQHKAKFKVGDLVIRTGGDTGLLETGNVYKVTKIEYDRDYKEGYGIAVEGGNTGYDPANFMLHKEHKVLTILREYEKNRKVLQRQSRG